MNGWQENMELTGPLVASEDAAYAIPIPVDVRETSAANHVHSLEYVHIL